MALPNKTPIEITKKNTHFVSLISCFWHWLVSEIRRRVVRNLRYNVILFVFLSNIIKVMIINQILLHHQNNFIPLFNWLYLYYCIQNSLLNLNYITYFNRYLKCVNAIRFTVILFQWIRFRNFWQVKEARVAEPAEAGIALKLHWPVENTTTDPKNWFLK